MLQLAIAQTEGKGVRELSFTKLEIETLTRIQASFGSEVPGLAAQVANARPVSRENTGAGFFTDISVDRSRHRR